MMKVPARPCVTEVEVSTVRQWLAPQELVIVAKGRAVRVGILPRRVGPEIKRCVDSHVLYGLNVTSTAYVVNGQSTPSQMSRRPRCRELDTVIEFLQIEL